MLQTAAGKDKCMCVSCDEETSLEKSKPYCKGNLGRRQCHFCNATVVALHRHSVKKPDIIKRYKKKTAAEKKEYMRAQKKKRMDGSGNPSSAPYDFSDLECDQKKSQKGRTFLM